MSLLRNIFARLFRRRPVRDIFQFWDGQHDRAVDPFEILRGIEHDPEFSPEKEAQFIAAGHDDSIEKAVRCVRRVFNVKHFNDGGLLEAECLELLEAFYDFLAALKKNTSPSPISSEPTGTESLPASTDPPPIPTSSSSDLPKTPTAAS